MEIGPLKDIKIFRDKESSFNSPALTVNNVTAKNHANFQFPKHGKESYKTMNDKFGDLDKNSHAGL